MLIKNPFYYVKLKIYSVILYLNKCMIKLYITELYEESILICTFNQHVHDETKLIVMVCLPFAGRHLLHSDQTERCPLSLSPQGFMLMQLAAEISLRRYN